MATIGSYQRIDTSWLRALSKGHAFGVEELLKALGQRFKEEIYRRKLLYYELIGVWLGPWVQFRTRSEVSCRKEEWISVTLA